MHAQMTRIAILWQCVKMENAFAVERELETENTAEVRLIINTDLIEGEKEMKVICLDVIYLRWFAWLFLIQ